MKATAHRSKTGQMFIVFAGALLVVVVICPLAAQGAEEYLWRAYTQGPKKKQDLLREANRRLKNLRLKASRHEEQELRWANDPDTRWLLTNRIPAMLILERELTAKPRRIVATMMRRVRTVALGRVDQPVVFAVEQRLAGDVVEHWRDAAVRSASVFFLCSFDAERKRNV